MYVVLFLAYDTISFHGKHFLVPEHSLRFQHKGTCLGPGSYYIEQQLEHHRTRTFQEEYLAFLEKHGARLDEKYLWD